MCLGLNAARFSNHLSFPSALITDSIKPSKYPYDVRTGMYRAPILTTLPQKLAKIAPNKISPIPK